MVQMKFLDALNRPFMNVCERNNDRYCVRTWSAFSTAQRVKKSEMHVEMNPSRRESFVVCIGTTDGLYADAVVAAAMDELAIVCTDGDSSTSASGR